MEAGDFNLFPVSCRLAQRRYVYDALSIATLLVQNTNPKLPDWILLFLCVEIGSVAVLQAT